MALPERVMSVMMSEKEKRKITGKVWLVGAGPGAPDLLTIKAKRVIEQADVVVYDALVGESVINLIPKAAEKIYVGKRAGNHTMPQEEIGRLLISLAQQGKKVVRLKGGDPFLFGRGGEELELLEQKGIFFEVVPGVTSALAVPAYFGIPVTHRGLASSVHIVTGHRKKGEPPGINFRALREAGGTLVFLMGVSVLHDIINGLMEAGMEPEMPAAVLQRGTSGRQKKISGTLATLEREVNRQGVSTPAVIVVGEVVSLGGRFAWFEKLPLFGKSFLVTRPGERSREFAERLRELGAEVVEAPAIKTEGIHPNRALRREVLRLTEYRYLVFTSPAGVAEFMRELPDMGKDVRQLGGILVAAIGSGTAKALRQYGIVADLVPEVYSGKALGALLVEHCAEGDRVLLARSDIGNPELITELRKEKDIKVTDVAVYRTIIGEIDGAEENAPGSYGQTAEAAYGADGVFFTSASTVRGFTSMYGGMDFSKVQALCIGEMTAREAEKYGMQVRIAKRADMESLVELAVEGTAMAP